MRYAVWGGVVGLLVGGFLVYQAFFAPPGYVENDNLIYPVAELDDQVTMIALRDYRLVDSWGQSAVFIARVEDDEGYRALSNISPYLGCTLIHAEDEQEYAFWDPCHSGFDPETNQRRLVFTLAGEALRAPEDVPGMYLHEVEIRGDELVIGKTRNTWRPLE